MRCRTRSSSACTPTRESSATARGTTPRARWRAPASAPGSHSWSQGIKDILVGRDPLQPERLWDLMYRSTAMSGRRGLVVAVLAASEVRLWDIQGKGEGK